MDNQPNPLDASQPVTPVPAPINGGQPTNTANVPAESPTPQKKSKIGLILGLSIGGVVLVGALVTVLILVLGGVSRQDYNDAYNIADDLRTSYNKINSPVYINAQSTESEMADKIEKLKENRTKFNSDFEKLRDLKAIKKDKKAAELFKRVDGEKANLDTFLDSTQEAYEKIYPLAKELDNTSYANKETLVPSLRDFQTKIGNLELKQKVNQEYINAIKTDIVAFISAIEAYMNMGDSSYDPSLYTNMSSASRKLREDDSTWRSNLNKLMSDAKFNDAINDLGKYITDKANNQ